MSLLIRGGRVVDPANEVDRAADILIVDGRITRVAKGVAKADHVVDAGNKLVIPGLVDIHVHLRDPGQEHKEDIESGTKAAAAGGVTSLCCMPNTNPVNDCRAITEYIVRTAQQVGCVRVFPIGAITKGSKGQTLCEYADMKEAGIVAVSDDGVCVMDAGLMRRALEYADTFELPLLQHCEDHHLSGNGAMNEGVIATKTGISCQPGEAESIIVGRDVELARLTGARYHACHLSVIPSLEHIRHAKAAGAPVTCEVTPHHFTLTDEACAGYNTAAKVNPPLRSGADVDAVKAALADGTVDAICTDHAPHATQDKEVEFGLAAFGISGIETLVPLSLALWRDQVVDLGRLVHLLTRGPAQALNLPYGTLSVGAPGDVTVIDPEQSWVVQPEKFVSKGKNTPFAGETMKGAVAATIVAGKVVFSQQNAA